MQLETLNSELATAAQQLRDKGSLEVALEQAQAGQAQVVQAWLCQLPAALSFC